MADVTPNKALPFLELGDAPDIAGGLEDLATAVDTHLTRMDTAIKVTVTSTSGNFAKSTSPAPRTIVVELVGPGGPSGGLAGAGSGQGESGAGGGGGYVKKTYAASALSASESFVIGTRGTAGASGANNGGNGTDSTFKGLTAGFGGPGSGSTASATAAAAAGGTGGTATGGDENIPGSQGGKGRVISGAAVLQSHGGKSFKSGEVQPPTAAGPGTAGSAYGGGAAGAFTTTANQAGAQGAAGVLIVTEIF
ncbi:hypothetical protein [Kribbella sp. CA-293567]|uniref:hypothetical protein n=1 Tax=Kribbella sp. CA-293567 TaxID=3002436 RepID=UPI0022DE9614|nr:hypothetical protein [Kribbella sp. CA-293567]WBQ02936.1 hypothetical protein OX958_23485 [Kribbella sp. CA-293567]